jgi:tetratricopeptide (TPR) repeat protein
MKKKSWIVLAVLLGFAACAEDRQPSGRSVTQVPEPEADLDDIDEPLLICLSQAKNNHHIARVYMGDGNLDEAIAAVRRILVNQCPDADEVEDVRLDAYAMLAKLLLMQGKLEDAMKAVDEGITKKTRDSFFLANLYTVKGEVYEAVAADLEPGSEQKRTVAHSAIDAYTKSNEINEAIQKKLYEDIKGAH